MFLLFLAIITLYLLRKANKYLKLRKIQKISGQTSKGFSKYATKYLNHLYQYQNRELWLTVRFCHKRNYIYEFKISTIGQRSSFAKDQIVFLSIEVNPHANEVFAYNVPCSCVVATILCL